MTKILGTLINNDVQVYLDDIIIYAKDRYEDDKIKLNVLHKLIKNKTWVGLSY